MRLLITIALLLAAPMASLAHVPGSEQTLAQTMSHQLIGLHHLPMMALLIALVWLLARLLTLKTVGEHAKKR